jgi:hypothetical protein
MADNTTLNAGTGGDVIATDDIGGVKYQRVKVTYGGDGTAQDVNQVFPLPVQNSEVTSVYRATFASQAVGASKVFLDLFNATGSGNTLRILSAFAYPDLDTAVVGTLGIELHLTRTTAVGTGGTAATLEGTSLTAPAISKMDPAMAALNANITSRAAPTGGATAGALLGTRYLFTEETNAGAAVGAALGVTFVGNVGANLLVPQNTGLRVVQGTVASVGNIGFEINFALA